MNDDLKSRVMELDTELMEFDALVELVTSDNEGMFCEHVGSEDPNDYPPDHATAPVMIRSLYRLLDKSGQVQIVPMSPSIDHGATVIVRAQSGSPRASVSHPSLPTALALAVLLCEPPDRMNARIDLMYELMDRRDAVMNAEPEGPREFPDSDDLKVAAALLENRARVDDRVWDKNLARWLKELQEAREALER